MKKAHTLWQSGTHRWLVVARDPQKPGDVIDTSSSPTFSGDVGAALLPPDESGLFVTDFDRHIRHAEGLHRRWMGSNEAKLDWCERVSRLQIDMLVPQHGAIHQGADVGRFIDWFAALPVGIVRPPAAAHREAA